MSEKRIMEIVDPCEHGEVGNHYPSWASETSDFCSGGSLRTTDTFTQRCLLCGETVNFIDGERVPGPCEHDLPSLVVTSDSDHTEGET